MDAVGNSQDGRFAHMVRRIWNGPEEAEEDSQMKSDRTMETGTAQPNYVPRAESYGQSSPRPAQPEFSDRGDFGPGYGENAKSSTVISRGTVVVGDIKSDSDIEMLGTVTGSISTSGNVKINGKQNGDVQGSGVSLSSCTVRGNLSAAEDITVDSDSVIVGDIKCGNLTFDGKLKGNVHVMGNVNCQGNAIIIGDIASTTITVDSGAKLQGKVQVSDGTIEQVDLPEDFAEPKNPKPAE